VASCYTSCSWRVLSGWMRLTVPFEILPIRALRKAYFLQPGRPLFANPIYAKTSCFAVLVEKGIPPGIAKFGGSPYIFCCPEGTFWCHVILLDCWPDSWLPKSFRYQNKERAHLKFFTPPSHKAQVDLLDFARAVLACSKMKLLMHIISLALLADASLPYR
jgi:hypothetical protein